MTVVACWCGRDFHQTDEGLMCSLGHTEHTAKDSLAEGESTALPGVVPVGVAAQTIPEQRSRMQALQAALPPGAFRTDDHRYYWNGKGPVPSVTTILNDVLNKPALITWKSQEVARAIYRDSAGFFGKQWEVGEDAAIGWALKQADKQRDMRILDLFCGGGGAAEGYARAGWEVVGVDIDPQPAYPFTFIQSDALEYLVYGGRLYDAIHASPPCQPYSKAVSSSSSKWNDTKGKDEPALIQPVREMLLAIGLPYVIENVKGAASELLDPIELCGSMFGLDIPRHRLFETSWGMYQPFHPRCSGIAKRAAERRGWDYRDMSVTGKGRRAGWSQRAAQLLDISHPMRQHDYKEAIPPAYTDYIGRELLKHLEVAA